jgi:hypothetical protein
VTGEEEPKIIAGFQEPLLEPDSEKSPQRTAARCRAHRLAEIRLNRRRVLGEEIYLVEAHLFFEKVAQRFGIALRILQRLQIVVAVDANADCPVLAHLIS